MDYQNSIDTITRYALGEQIDDASYNMIRLFTDYGNIGDIAEVIVSNYMGYKNAEDSIHGCDAFNTEGRAVEIKTERKTPLAGNAAWTSTNYEDKLIKLIKSDQEYLQVGFTSKGRLIYIIRTELNKTGIITKIGEAIENHKGKSTNLTPKTTHTQLGDNFEVVYLSEKYLNKTPVSGVFKKKLLENYKKDLTNSVECRNVRYSQEKGNDYVYS